MTLFADHRTTSAPEALTGQEMEPEAPRGPRGRLVAPTRRRAGLVALAVALIATGGGTGAWLLTRSTEYVDVLVVAAPVARGERLEPGDLTTTSMPEDTLNLRTLDAGDLDVVVGQVATTDLTIGELLSPSHVAAELSPPDGTSLVGVALTAAQRPALALPAGQRVRFVATPPVGGEAPLTDPATIDAVVVSITTVEGGASVVNVEVPTAAAAELAALAATGRIALVLDPGQG